MSKMLKLFENLYSFCWVNGAENWSILPGLSQKFCQAMTCRCVHSFWVRNGQSLEKKIRKHNKYSLTDYDGDIPAFIPEKYFLNVNFEAL